MAKYIIIGLGNFGAELGSRLTGLGHEVIGVDADFSKVQINKDNVTIYSVQLNFSIP